MKLFEVKVDYKTQELLSAMMEVSRLHADNPLYKSIQSPHQRAVERMTTIGLGRRTGQTTAIVNYIKSNKAEIYTLVITHNQQMAKHFERQGIYALSISSLLSRNSFFSNSVVINPDSNKPVDVIFDVCKSDEVVKALEVITMNDRNQILRGVVNVSPMY